MLYRRRIIKVTKRRICVIILSYDRVLASTLSYPRMNKTWTWLGNATHSGLDFAPSSLKVKVKCTAQTRFNIAFIIGSIPTLVLNIKLLSKSDVEMSGAVSLFEITHFKRMETRGT